MTGGYFMRCAVEYCFYFLDVKIDDSWKKVDDGKDIWKSVVVHMHM